MPWVKSSHEETLKKYPHLKDFLPVLDVSNAESPRGSVLVVCSFLDDRLRTIIDNYLVEDSDKAQLLDGFNAPLGTFASRIKSAHWLGLISDEERDDCDTLRKIRNEFAHNFRTSFADNKLVDLCKNLHHSAKDHGDVIVDAYGQFSTGATGLVLNLVNRAHYVSRSRLKKKNGRVSSKMGVMHSAPQI